MVRNKFHKYICPLLACCIIIFSVVPIHATTIPSEIAILEALDTVASIMDHLSSAYTNSQTTLNESIELSILQSLTWIFCQSYGYDIVNPYSGSSDTYHRYSASFGQTLMDLNNSVATLGLRFFRPMLNDLDGLSQAVSDIKTYDYNTAAATNAALQLMGDQVNINWINTHYESVLSVADNFAQSNPISKPSTAIPAGTYYFKLAAFGYTDISSYNAGVWKFQIPIRSNAAGRINDYIESITFLDRYGDVFEPSYFLEYNILASGDYSLVVYIMDAPFTWTYSNYLQITFKVPWNYYNESQYVYYMSADSEDYVKFASMLYLRSLNDNQFTDRNIVNALNDMALVDNNVKMTVPVTVQNVIDANSIVSNTRNWFDTGTSITTLVSNLDTQYIFEWFSDNNTDIVNNLSGGYVNVYN